MVKINQLEIENVKRVKAVAITPDESGLTIIGGKNGQGKTSVLDAIAWALGGDRFRPSQAQREGSVTPPALRVTLSNGIVVERKGKNGDLKVIDSRGNRSGQQLLNEFVEALALDLPRFINSSGKEKAQTLLKIIGVGDTLYTLEQQEQQLYNRRHALGQIADQKKKYADELEYYHDAPNELISPSELIRQQQDILARNGENQRKRMRAAELESQKQALRRQLDEIQSRYDAACRDCDIAARDAAELLDESTEELEQNIRDIEAINQKVRVNLEKERAEDDASAMKKQYEDLTDEIEVVRKHKLDLLNGANLPLPGLSVDDGELTYNGYRWDSLSGSDQLRVAAAIVRRLNPQCGFVLMDKLEQMDVDTLREFGEWLESEGLQAIATRVSTGPECSIIITDGYAEPAAEDQKEPEKWQAGRF